MQIRKLATSTVALMLCLPSIFASGQTTSNKLKKSAIHKTAADKQPHEITEQEELINQLQTGYANAIPSLIGPVNYEIFLVSMCHATATIYGSKEAVTKAAEAAFTATLNDALGYNRSNAQKNCVECISKADLHAALEMLARVEPPQPRVYTECDTQKTDWYDTSGVAFSRFCAKYVEGAGPSGWLNAFTECVDLGDLRAQLGGYPTRGMALVYQTAVGYPGARDNPQAIPWFSKVLNDILRNFSDRTAERFIDEKEGFFFMLTNLQGKAPADWFELALRVWLKRLDETETTSKQTEFHYVGGVRYEGENLGWIAKSCGMIKNYKDLDEKYSAICKPQNGEDPTKAFGFHARVCRPLTPEEIEYNKNSSLGSYIRYSATDLADAMSKYNQIAPEYKAFGLQYLLPNLDQSPGDNAKIQEQKQEAFNNVSADLAVEEIRRSLATDNAQFTGNDRPSDRKWNMLVAQTMTSYFVDPPDFHKMVDKVFSVGLELFKNPIRYPSNMTWTGSHDGFTGLCELGEFMGQRREERKYFLNQLTESGNLELIPALWACTLRSSKPEPSNWWTKSGG